MIIRNCVHRNVPVSADRHATMAGVVFRRRSGLSPIPHTDVAPLTPTEISWRDRQLEVARLLVEHYTGDAPSLPTLDQLDSCIANWRLDRESRIHVNTLINGVGIAFGEHLARDGRLDWVIATDVNGTDLALHGQPGDIIIFPANALAKRVVDGATDFVRPLHHALLDGVDRRRRLG